MSDLPPERLLELLQAAITDCEGGDEHRAELTVVLASPILPVPASATLIDPATRIGAARLVQRSARGADLGGWLFSVESATKDLDEDDTYAQLLTRVPKRPARLGAPLSRASGARSRVGTECRNTRDHSPTSDRAQPQDS